MVPQMILSWRNCGDLEHEIVLAEGFDPAILHPPHHAVIDII